MVRRQYHLLSLAALLLSGLLDAQPTEPVWQADLGNGTYQNPILFLDYSDPDVVRVGDDYFMTASSFNCVPGLPILHSKDLVNWQLINYALPALYPEDVFEEPQHFKGVWAPCIRYHQGEYFIYYGDPDFGIYMLKTEDPAGPWSQPVLVKAGKGLIDPSPLWDEDGQAYLIHAWAASRVKVNALLTVHRMNAEGTRVVDRGRHVFDGHDDHPTVEGPKFYKRNGYYYIFAPAGGVATGWQLVLRARQILGPYEEKVVLAQGSTAINGPHQGGWVDTQTGESWFIHFQDREAYGRVVHLQPVRWVDDWPVMGNDEDGDGQGEPVRRYSKPDVGQSHPVQVIPASDDFADGRPGLQWQWHANPHLVWMAGLPGTDHLRLFAMPRPASFVNHWGTPSLLLQKFPGPDFVATTVVELHSSGSEQSAGLIVMGRSYYSLQISQSENGFELSQVICEQADKGRPEQVVAREAIGQSRLFLRVGVRAPAADCVFSYSTDGRSFTRFGKPFRAVAGGWIGAKVGLYCTKSASSPRGGYADFQWFEVTQ